LIIEEFKNKLEEVIKCKDILSEMNQKNAREFEVHKDKVF
jgi:hypothetical protein